MKAQRHLLGFLLWFLLSVLVVNFIFLITELPAGILRDDPDVMKNEVLNLESENEQLRSRINEVGKQLVSYQESFNQGLTTKEILENERDHYRMLAAQDAVYGEGIIVILSDSTNKYQDYTAKNKNEYLVHDFDVNKVVLDLQSAGAEAIEINGERYLFGYSHLNCNGPTIRINGHVYAQPFIIKAIGDRNRLKKSVTEVNSYAHGLKQFGLFVEANTSVNIEITNVEISENEFNDLERSAQ